MTGFLNQGLERLVLLYEDTCGLNKMLETKLKKAETTTADQAAIATAKSQHHEDKYKAMTRNTRLPSRRLPKKHRPNMMQLRFSINRTWLLIGKASRAPLSSLSSKSD
ncbi:hypothetical protein HanRHA438_Chr09g0411261 [Helianthus annuus]|uniref:Uncharacterized protein n=1 Tax=Helianthus annuus TaxID=4232 RepID=A0A9K3I7S1_HELAN|nr:hypothetical protein HanXRQr2_Chr09g0399481 [Helianthus annuus]KAJ0526861.1 hypothetical protein HanHA300_Chr09g0327871 [Helianthus annuus]KAJ0535407.1 hypothetical protein HanIR_Chr09g0430351 [Helianthus annuus]KAJ0543257.1 hypothetical protein HanHA89_Chr09g0348791 [Helianthus annuus]KAJ0708314.1 hypothetical protein HanLR1_Chr09g0328131 [Helianthus annuus]